MKQIHLVRVHKGAVDQYAGYVLNHRKNGLIPDLIAPCMDKESAEAVYMHHNKWTFANEKPPYVWRVNTRDELLRAVQRTLEASNARNDRDYPLYEKGEYQVFILDGYLVEIKSIIIR